MIRSVDARSGGTRVRIVLNLPYLVANADGAKHMNRTVTAQVFAELARASEEAQEAVRAILTPHGISLSLARDQGA